jgi:hypothetical protein
MDSYNRGYGQGVKNLLDAGALGNASIITFPDSIRAGWESSGFYALAYKVTGVEGIADGSKIISYRGTDQIGGLDGDFLNGWTLGGGLASASQGRLAIEFYNAVLGNRPVVAGLTPVSYSVFDRDAPAITATGHSLGGGLAGFVGTLAGGAAVGFDHMPFLAATYAAFITEFRARARDFGDAEDVLPTDELLTRYNLRRPSFENYKGIALQGEVNRLLRDGTIALAIGGLLGAVPYVGPFLAALGGYVAGGQLAGEQALGNRNSELPTYDWSRRSDDPILSQDRHSIATLIIAKFAALQEEGNSAFAAWRAGGTSDLLYSALYDDAIAEALPGTESRDGKSKAAVSTIRSAIAYSALGKGAENEGEKPFGDTGIWSLFNDARDLGNVLAGDEASFFGTQIGGLIFGRKDIKQYLADLTVQYAGALALYDVEQADGRKISIAAGEVDAHEGVLRLTNGTLAVDVSTYLWGDILKSNRDPNAATKLTADRLDPLNLATFRTAFFDRLSFAFANDNEAQGIAA